MKKIPRKEYPALFKNSANDTECNVCTQTKVTLPLFDIDHFETISMCVKCVGEDALFSHKDTIFIANPEE